MVPMEGLKTMEGDVCRKEGMCKRCTKHGKRRYIKKKSPSVIISQGIPPTRQHEDLPVPNLFLLALFHDFKQEKIHVPDESRYLSL
jgi:hypothetical protein